MASARLSRLVRQLRARNVPQAILHATGGRFELLPHDSPRLVRMLESPKWSRSIIGIFTPDVPLADLLSAVLA